MIIMAGLIIGSDDFPDQNYYDLHVFGSINVYGSEVITPANNHRAAYGYRTNVGYGFFGLNSTGLYLDDLSGFDLGFSITGNDVMKITSRGHVKVGPGYPSGLLHVESGSSTDRDGADIILAAEDTTGAGKAGGSIFLFPGESDDDLHGRVIIGSDDFPDENYYDLQVFGSLYVFGNEAVMPNNHHRASFGTENNVGYGFTELNGTGFFLDDMVGYSIGISVSGDEKMRIDSAGRVGIGTISSGYLLEVGGSAGKPGGGTWSDTSDARLIKYMAPLNSADALETINRLQGVKFQWINPDEHAPGIFAGVTAQNMETVFPDWVLETGPEGKDAELISKDDKVKAITYPHEFNAYLIESVKELSSRLEQLEGIVKQQALQIENQKSRIAELEGSIH